MLFSERLLDVVAEKAIQFLGLAYLKELEKLEDGGLMSELIFSLKTEELSELCRFFWMLRKRQVGAQTGGSRVLEFWGMLADVVREREIVIPELQSSLNLLAVFIEEITPEITRMWSEAAPYAHERHNGHVLIEQLARLAAAYPDSVAMVFRAALSGFLPEYDPDDVVSCVKQLADAVKLDDAEWICNEYAARGSVLLKDTYESLRAAQRA
jgi:hypothetical protein